MITDYFEDKQIEYWTSGKNVSKGWMGIQCIFCDDHSNHLGINLSGRYYHCWLCGAHDSVVNLIMEIEQCEFYEAKKILSQIWEDGFSLSVVEKKKASSFASTTWSHPPTNFK